MNFRDGKFYDEKGNMIPLEFGNKEQIQIIDRANALREGVCSLDKVIKCLCGYRWSPKFTESNDVSECVKCGLKFKFYLYGGQIPCIKTINN